MCSLFTQVPVDCYTVRLLPDDARVKPREGNKGARGTGGSAQSPFIRLIHQFYLSLSLLRNQAGKPQRMSPVLLSRITPLLRVPLIYDLHYYAKGKFYISFINHQIIIQYCSWIYTSLQCMHGQRLSLDFLLFCSLLILILGPYYYYYYYYFVV